jgi:signal transduction histidine kinase
MLATGLLRNKAVEVGWGLFAAANFVAMVVWPDWETIPFHFVWISLTIVYGFRVWSLPATAAVLAAVVGLTGASIMADAFEGTQLWGELFEVPLMSAMFLAMVWHARRRQEAQEIAETRAEAHRSLLERQQRFLHDASHELRTPVTIARGHLELLRRSDGERPELAVAVEELDRIDRIVEHLLLLAQADHADFLIEEEIDLEVFLEDVFMRWSDVAPRVWRLGAITPRTVSADPQALRTALDALLDNAVKHTGPHDLIELRAGGTSDAVTIEVEDGGDGVPADALDHIFDRFARADPARGRAHDGFGLGLAIVDAIAKGHGGRCSVSSSPSGSTFSLRLPRVSRSAPQLEPEQVGHSLAPVTSEMT